ncbi:TetR/AcrR family transcriptional regulator [Kaustia mangrovi]|uniref:TetR/AcrR family transcriptional regulator n=1 Tax=Kaustia mangrovi TaxID=2593653 RepID=A0A7S8C3U4_9HYPH|nr:TetR/AcrR family transcriptional regulator [Kaustia mangrovi]QPC42843.1 TetR/AcrR family transcriptional regulator [Kaustia mangrovi]
MTNKASAPLPPAEPGSRTTKLDWLRAAVAALVADGIEGVKVQTIAQKLGVSRSSFYWFFKSRQDLLDHLLDYWLDTNTAPLIARAERPADSACRSVLSIFECWVDEALFDPKLDIAVRDWARRSQAVRKVVDLADERRVTAIAAMFERHGYPREEAFIRARVLYFMQIGYYSLGINEPMETRMSYVAAYLRCFTGLEPTEEEIGDFHAFLKGGGA